MDYKLTKPCDNCPFRREGGIRLTKHRIREITRMLLGNPGGMFPCHKTTVTIEDDDGESDRACGPKSQHCAGALIFADNNGTHTQMMRIAGRLGMWHPDDLQDRDAVFDDVREMLKTAIR